MIRKRWIPFLLTALLLCGCGKKPETAAPVDAVLATVNGESLLQSQCEPYRQKYLSSYTTMGADMTDGDVNAYIEDMALTACIQDLLIQQDITKQGFRKFDEQVESWLAESGKETYQKALADAESYLRSTLGESEDADLSAAAKTYAENTGITEQSCIELYRDQYAYALYCSWLTKDVPVTDADVQAAYDTRVEESKARFENSAEAFETALATGEEAWYLPDGYRYIQQILLPAKGETAEEKLASVQPAVEDIYTRLSNNVPFATLIAEYGTDSRFDDPEFAGYLVHRDSILWDPAFTAAAFAEELNEPGTWSAEPVVSDAGIHILFYKDDAKSGPAELTENLKDALSYTLYQQRLEAAYAARLEELSAAAEVVYPS